MNDGLETGVDLPQLARGPSIDCFALAGFGLEGGAESWSVGEQVTNIPAHCDRHLHWSSGDDRGIARLESEDPSFAKDIARAQICNVTAAAMNGDIALDQQEELVGDVPFFDQNMAARPFFHSHDGGESRPFVVGNVPQHSAGT